MERRAGWQGNREALEPLSLRANPVPGVVRSAAGWRPGDIWLPRVPAAPTAHGKESRPPWVTAPLRGKESLREEVTTLWTTAILPLPSPLPARAGQGRRRAAQAS